MLGINVARPGRNIYQIWCGLRLSIPELYPTANHIQVTSHQSWSSRCQVLFGTERHIRNRVQVFRVLVSPCACRIHAIRRRPSTHIRICLVAARSASLRGWSVPSLLALRACSSSNFLTTELAEVPVAVTGSLFEPGGTWRNEEHEDRLFYGFPGLSFRQLPVLSPYVRGHDNSAWCDGRFADLYDVLFPT